MKKIDAYDNLISLSSDLNKSSGQRIIQLFEKEIASDSLKLCKDTDGYLELDIGIGSLLMEYDSIEDTINYKFIPSNSLQRLIKNSVRTETDPLVSYLESNLTTLLKKMCNR